MAPDPYEWYSSNGWTSFIQQFGGHRIFCLSLIQVFITLLKKDWYGGLNTSPCLDDWDCFKNSLSIGKFLNLFEMILSS